MGINTKYYKSNDGDTIVRCLKNRGRERFEGKVVQCESNPSKIGAYSYHFRKSKFTQVDIKQNTNQ